MHDLQLRPLTDQLEQAIQGVKLNPKLMLMAPPEKTVVAILKHLLKKYNAKGVILDKDRLRLFPVYPGDLPGGTIERAYREGWGFENRDISVGHLAALLEIDGKVPLRYGYASA